MRRWQVGDVADAIGRRVVTSAELRACGVASSTETNRCRSGGPWQRMLPGVVLLHSGPPARADHRVAALLYGGRGGVSCRLTGLDALQLHGMRRCPAPTGPVHVLVPTGVQRGGSAAVLVEQTARLPRSTGTFATVPLARAALDFTRRCRDRDTARSVLAEVVQRGRCTPGELVAELTAGSNRGSALPRAVLAEVGAGVRSVAEADGRRLLIGSGLPTPLWNPRLHDADGRLVAVPDAWFDELAVAWEIDSVEWHLGPEEYAATVARRNRLEALGVIVVSHLPRDLRRDRRRVLADLAAALARAADRPRPALYATPAP